MPSDLKNKKIELFLSISKMAVLARKCFFIGEENKKLVDSCVQADVSFEASSLFFFYEAEN